MAKFEFSIFWGAKKQMKFMINKFTISLICLPFIVFFGCLVFYSVNVPWLDDFEVAPITLFRWLQESDLGEKIAIIWQPNNEHRVVTLKLLVLFNYYIFGQLNFKWMIWQSHLYLLPLFYLIWKSLPKENRLVLFIPIPFLYLNFQYFLSTYWMIASVQHNLVIGFGGISMYLLAKSNQKQLWLAILFTMLSCLSNSDGLFFIPIGAMILLIQYRLKELFMWTVFLSTAILMFFWKYPSMNYHENGLQFFSQHPLKSLQGFFVFMGGGFDFWYREQSLFRIMVTALVGVGLLVVVGLAFLKYIRKYTYFQMIKLWKDGTLASSQELFPISMFLFCLINALVISVLRSSFGDFVYLISNYKIYPTLALIFVYMIAVFSWKKVKQGNLIIIMASIVFWAASIANSLSDVQSRSISLRKDSEKVRKGGDGLGFSAAQQEMLGIQEAMHYLESNGIYHAD